VSEYLAQYGYLVVALGALLEGESVLLLSGLAAQQGALDLGLVLVIGAAGAFAGDQFLFHLARRWGRAWFARRPQLGQRVAVATRLLERHSTVFILGFRFVLGMRNLGAMVVGVSNVPTRRFVILNLIAAAVWATVVVYVGYLFGEAAVALLNGVESIEKLVLVAAVLIGLAALASWLLRRWLLRRPG
jgi:membrane protein DedA with SNARE-associated domain